MTFEEALKHEENNVPVTYNDQKYYVEIGRASCRERV